MASGIVNLDKLQIFRRQTWIYGQGSIRGIAWVVIHFTDDQRPHEGMAIFATERSSAERDQSNALGLQTPETRTVYRGTKMHVVNKKLYVGSQSIGYNQPNVVTTGST